MSIHMATMRMREMAEDIGKSKKAQEITTAIGPTAIGVTITATTGSTLLGTAGKAIASDMAKSNPERFTEEAANLALAAVIPTASIVLVPVVIGFLVVDGIKSLWKKIS